MSHKAEEEEEEEEEEQQQQQQLFSILRAHGVMPIEGSSEFIGNHEFKQTIQVEGRRAPCLSTGTRQPPPRVL